MGKRGLYNERHDGCWLCGNPNVEQHHVYGGVGRRPISDREGCYIYLCHEHHQGRVGVHQDVRFRDWLRRDCQERWEEREGLRGREAHDAFRELFGASYAWEAE